MDVDLLIKLVKKHVYLYDRSHKKYKDIYMKAAVWESIGKQLNKSTEAVKHKWKTVRDGYIKYKKQLRQSEESGRKIIEYVWSSQLLFLDNCNISRRYKSISNYEPQIELLYDDSNGSQGLSNSQALNCTTLLETENVLQAKRRRISEQGDDVEIILNYISNSRTNSNDAVDHLFMSYAETFKKFSPRRQAAMKLELAQLFSKAELSELQHFKRENQNNDDDGDLQTHITAEYLYDIKSEID